AALSRSVSTSLAPLLRSRRATSAPIPRAPPVMKTTLPLSEVIAPNVPLRLVLHGNQGTVLRTECAITANQLTMGNYSSSSTPEQRIDRVCPSVGAMGS